MNFDKIKTYLIRRYGRRISIWLPALAAGWLASRYPEIVAQLGGQEELAGELHQVLGNLREVVWGAVTAGIGAAGEARAPKDSPE